MSLPRIIEEWSQWTLDRLREPIPGPDDVVYVALYTTAPDDDGAEDASIVEPPMVHDAPELRLVHSPDGPVTIEVETGGCSHVFRSRLTITDNEVGFAVRCDYCGTPL